MRLPAMNLRDGDPIEVEMHQRDRRKQLEHDRGRWRCRLTLVSRNRFVPLLQVLPNLTLDHAIDQPTHHCEHRQGGNALGLFQPHRADGDGILDPPKPRLHRLGLIPIRFDDLGIATGLLIDGGGQNQPAKGLHRRREQHQDDHRHRHRPEPLSHPCMLLCTYHQSSGVAL